MSDDEITTKEKIQYHPQIRKITTFLKSHFELSKFTAETLAVVKNERIKINIIKVTDKKIY